MPETFNGETVWQGDIEVFDLTGHPKATRAYAWSYATTGAKRRYVAVLKVPLLSRLWLPCVRG